MGKAGLGGVEMHAAPLPARLLSTRYLRNFLVVLLSVLAWPSCARSQMFTSRYEVKVEMVGLFASVYNREGKLVKGLGRKDFIVYEEGVRQVVSQFSREYVPLSVLVLLDTSGSMLGSKLDNARRCLIQFLKRLNRGDEAMLMTFEARPRVTQTFTKDLGKIEKVLRRLDGKGATALYDTVLQSLDVIKQAQNRRRALLLISDGINTVGRCALNDTIAGLRRSGVELYAIGIESDRSDDIPAKAETQAILNSLTASAGGQAFMVTDKSDLARVCRTISDQMRNQYALAYYSPATKPEEWRSIRVETKMPGLTVVPSKKGYYPATDP
jgi:VWFA-related protein